MKKLWSGMWSSSVQPRKQRKFRHNAPLHVRRKFMSCHLSPELRKRFGKRSIPVRKGDEAEVMRGGFKGLRGTVDRVDLAKSRVYIEEIKVKKVDGSEVMKPLRPSNLKLVKLNLDDKRRQAVLERAERAREKKPEARKAKPEKEKKSKPRIDKVKKKLKLRKRK